MALEVSRLKAENEELKAALKLARYMFVANKLLLPNTFEAIDKAMSGEREG
jgi:hypothetical protein